MFPYGKYLTKHKKNKI